MRTYIIILGLLVVIYLAIRLRNRAAGGNGYQKIAPAEVKKRMDSGEKVFLVDVRTPEEYGARHIPNSVSIPLDRLEQQINKKITDKSTPIFVYCLSGSRSARAAGILVKLGYSHVYNMGAMGNWPGKMETGK
jgi:rhodanese-related sulfurtransferase